MPAQTHNPDRRNPPGQCQHPTCTLTAWIDGGGYCPRHMAGRVTFTDVEPPPRDDDTQPGAVGFEPLTRLGCWVELGEDDER